MRNEETVFWHSRRNDLTVLIDGYRLAAHMPPGLAFVKISWFVHMCNASAKSTRESNAEWEAQFFPA
jgi:hypothetical protein